MFFFLPRASSNTLVGRIKCSYQLLFFLPAFTSKKEKNVQVDLSVNAAAGGTELQQRWKMWPTANACDSVAAGKSFLKNCCDEHFLEWAKLQGIVAVACRVLQKLISK